MNCETKCQKNILTSHFNVVSSIKNSKSNYNSKITDQSFVDLVSSDDENKDDSLLIIESVNICKQTQDVPQLKYCFNESDSDDDLNIPLSQRLGYNKFISAPNDQERISVELSLGVEQFNEAVGDVLIENKIINHDTSVSEEDEANITITPTSTEVLIGATSAKSQDFLTISQTSSISSQSSLTSNCSNKLKRRSPDELERIRLEKEKKKFEREQAKRIKEKTRKMYQEKSKAIREAASSQNLKECEKLCYTFVDSKICESSVLKELLENCFADNNAPLTLTSNPLIPFGIHWTREVRKLVESECVNDNEDNDVPLSQLNVVYEDQEQDQLMIILYEKDFIPMCVASKQKLNQKVDETLTLHNFVIDILEKYQKHLIIVLYGYQSYLRRLRNQENKDYLIKTGFEKSKKNNRTELNLPVVKKTDLELAIIDNVVRLNDHNELKKFNVNIIMAENSADLVRIISSTTKAVAIAEAKRECRNQYGLDWYAEADNYGNVDLKDEKEYTTLWIRQLASFPKISFDMAKAIAAVYPTPQDVLKKYKLCPTLDDKISLLSNIQVTRSNCIKTTVKKLGPHVSRKIYTFLTTRNENDFIN